MMITLLYLAWRFYMKTIKILDDNPTVPCMAFYMKTIKVLDDNPTELSNTNNKKTKKNIN